MLCKIRKFYEVLIIKVPETEVEEHFGFSAYTAEEAYQQGVEFINETFVDPSQYVVYVNLHPMEAGK